MMRGLFIRHLRHYARLIAATCAGLFLFEMLLLWVAARIEMGAGVRAFIEALVPEDVRAVIFSQFGLASFEGAVGFGFQHPFALVAAFALIIAIATTGAAERESGFLDLILARPLTRWRYLAALVLLLLTVAVLLPAAQLAGVATGLRLLEATDPPWTSYAGSAAALALLLLLVGGYTLLFAAFARRRGSAIAPAVGLTLLFYWIDFLAGFWDALASLRWASPFHYFHPVRAAVGGGLTPLDGTVLLAGSTLALAAAFIAFRRQDL